MQLEQMCAISVDLDSLRLTRFGRAALLGQAAAEMFSDWPDLMRELEESGVPMGASFSDYAENKILDHALGKASWTMPTTVALALCTTVPTDSSTGATIVEANYTGYARLRIAAADLNAASAGSSSNANVLTFAACTAGSSTVTGFAICDSTTTGAGNAIAWGTCSSTVISTTQTPATVAAGALVVTQD